MAAYGVEEKVEPLQKRVMSTGGIGWVGMTAAVWIAAVWMATATMVCHMKETLAGGSFHRLHPLATQLHNDVFLSVWLKARLAVAIQLQLGSRLSFMNSDGQAVTVAEGHR